MITESQKKEIYELHFLKNLSLREISEQTGIHRSTVTDWARLFESEAKSFKNKYIESQEPDFDILNRRINAKKGRNKTILTEDMIRRIESRFDNKQFKDYTEIFEDLKKYNFEISYTSVCNGIKIIKERRANGFQQRKI
jgi:predicted DNA-binding protein YlxM (UPF0122 family)